MLTMKSMELDDEEKMDATSPIPMPEAPEFPYGLRICLTDCEFEKLGIDPSNAQVGETFHIFALAKVTSISSNDGDGGSHFRLEAQITDMALESEDEENEAADAY